jgi:hypothetical protein
MAAKPGFLDYLTAAFNARPIGMFVAPNWIGLAAIGILGVANPGFWVLGAGLELGYLLTLATNKRFQNTVSGKPLTAARQAWNQKISKVLDRLDPADVRTYDALAARCRSILDLQLQNADEPPEGLEQQADSLGRLSWMFLRLLLARRTIGHVMGGAQNDAELQKKIASLERQQHQTGLSEELSRSLGDITATLGSTGQWIRDQQQVYGAMEDLLTEPPPLAPDARAREIQ